MQPPEVTTNGSVPGIDSVLAADSPPQPAPPPPAVLSATVTAGLAVLLVGGYLVLQALLMTAGALLYPPWDAHLLARLPQQLQAHAGWLFSWATLLAAPAASALAAVLLWRGARRVETFIPVAGGAGAAWRRHLGLVRPRWSQIALWAAGTGAFLAVYEMASRWLDRPPLPDFMVDFYATAGSVTLLGVAVVVAAPLVEEVLFRGFLLPGLAAGRPGPVAAVVASALLWAAIHAQYDLFDVSAVFVLGLLFGTARLRSRSLFVPFLLHVGVNLVALVQLHSALGGS
jgi:hypothetical protein